jgi:hypothetical protein
VAVELARVESGPEHITEFAAMMGDRAARFRQRADLLARGAAAPSPAPVCTRGGTWWHGTDLLFDDPAIIIANGHSDDIPDLAGQIAELLEAALS